MKLIKISVLVLISMSVLVVTSCKSNTSKSEGQQVDEIDMPEMDQEEVKSEIEEVVYPLPSPFELTELLNDMGARYEGAVLNKPANAEKYITEKDKALNLGVFAADLSYTVNYDKKQEMNVYLKATKTLVDGLDITVDYGYLLEESAKEAARNKDSLVNLISKTYYDTYDFLRKNNNAELATLMTAGFWIESMYIANHISDYTFDNTEIVKIIYNQKESLNKLISLLEDYKDSEAVMTFLPSLVSIKEAFDNAETSLTKQQLAIIKNAIAEARKSIVD